MPHCCAHLAPISYGMPRSGASPQRPGRLPRRARNNRKLPRVDRGSPTRVASGVAGRARPNRTRRCSTRLTEVLDSARQGVKIRPVLTHGSSAARTAHPRCVSAPASTPKSRSRTHQTTDSRGRPGMRWSYDVDTRILDVHLRDARPGWRVVMADGVLVDVDRTAERRASRSATPTPAGAWPPSPTSSSCRMTLSQTCGRRRHSEQLLGPPGTRSDGVVTDLEPHLLALRSWLHAQRVATTSTIRSPRPPANGTPIFRCGRSRLQSSTSTRPTGGTGWNQAVRRHASLVWIMQLVSSSLAARTASHVKARSRLWPAGFADRLGRTLNSSMDSKRRVRSGATTRLIPRPALVHPPASAPSSSSVRTSYRPMV